MEKMNHICRLADRCKLAGGERCNVLCPPFMLLHGLEGNTGLWRGRNVPPKYKDCFLKDLPIKEDNPVAYAWVQRYVGNILENVENGNGLFFFSVPNANNRLGTGTGKTTAAITILNEYVIARVIQHSKGEKAITELPGLFYKASEFQNVYNAQFRGTPEMQDEASRKFYRVKKLLMSVELLVMDDIGIRQKITDAFENELTEVIDSRDTNVLTTIYTSNLPVEKLADTVGDRIASRIEGMTEKVAFKGKDHRKGGVL
jgi:DNA replication protein DnaC